MSFPPRSHFKIFQDRNSSMNQWCLGAWILVTPMATIASRKNGWLHASVRATFHTVALDEFGSPGSPEWCFWFVASYFSKWNSHRRPGGSGKQSGHILRKKKNISLKISITPSGEFHAANFKSQKSMRLIGRCHLRPPTSQERHETYVVRKDGHDDENDFTGYPNKHMFIYVQLVAIWSCFPTDLI